MPSKDYAPTRQQFETALNQLNLTSLQERLLAIHAQAHKHTLTATELAHLVGYKNKATANAQYGRLGRLVGAALNIKNDLELPVAHLVDFGRNDQQEITWVLRTPLAEAVHRFGFASDESSEVFFPEEVSADRSYSEGAVRRISVNAYERNSKARAECISQFGYQCSVCRLLMTDMYGETGLHYTHVHHLTGLAEVGRKYQVDPKTDLRPVCPNCHAMLHTSNPPLSIEALQRRIQANQRSEQGVAGQPATAPNSTSESSAKT